MTRSVITTPPGLHPAPSDSALGWYLYGITRRGVEPSTLVAAHNEPLELIEFAGLAAVVRLVPLADFSTEILRKRLQSDSDLQTLEVMARSHNDVIGAIHMHQAVLPAKFGMVYSDARDIVSALRSARDTLLPQLDRLEGCDEWAVHVYAERAVLRERVSASDETIARLREQYAAARPGRAYFVERQLRDAIEAASEQALMTLAQDAFDALSRFAVAGQLSTIPQPSTPAADEVEIVRAAFLVRRENVELFTADVNSAGADDSGLRCECSGPWPPYSFAIHDVEAM